MAPPTQMNEDLLPLLDLTPATSLALVWSSDKKQMTLSQRAAAKLKVKFELKKEEVALAAKKISRIVTCASFCAFQNS